MSVFVYSVRLANEGCQNKVWGIRSQLFTKENRQMKEKDSVKRQKGRKMWERQKGEIESEIRGNRNAVANFLSPTGSGVDNASWQLASPGRHPFCIVNKRFKGKCQLRDRKSSFGYNISFLLPADAAAQLPGKWRTWWVMRMAHTTCSIGGDSNRGWHHSVYRSSRPLWSNPIFRLSTVPLCEMREAGAPADFFYHVHTLRPGSSCYSLIVMQR